MMTIPLLIVAFALAVLILAWASRILIHNYLDKGGDFFLVTAKVVAGHACTVALLLVLYLIFRILR
jgi:hypothetical protein